MLARSIVIATLGALASAHMAMIKPCSYYTPGNDCPDPPAGQSVDYSLSSPLARDAPFCKYTVPYDKPVETWTAGQTVNIEFTKNGGAGHGGGHCQFSISYDGKNFAVVHEVLRHCFYNGPSTSNTPDVRSYSFALPKDLPNSDNAIFAWTWVNKQGNREFYCGTSNIAITGSSSSSYTGKEMTIANHDGYETIPEFGDNYDTGLDLYEKAKTITVSPDGSADSGSGSGDGQSKEEPGTPASSASDLVADSASVTSSVAENSPDSCESAADNTDAGAEDTTAESAEDGANSESASGSGEGASDSTDAGAEDTTAVDTDAGAEDTTAEDTNAGAEDTTADSTDAGAEDTTAVDTDAGAEDTENAAESTDAATTDNEECTSGLMRCLNKGYQICSHGKWSPEYPCGVEPFGPSEPYLPLDLGASVSMCNDAHAFTSITRKNGKIHTISGDIGVHGRGTATLDGQIKVNNVLHAPGSKLNLLSVSHLVCNNTQVLFDSRGAYMYKNGKAALYAPIQDGLNPIMSSSLNNARLAEALTIYGGGSSNGHHSNMIDYNDNRNGYDGDSYSGNGDGYNSNGYGGNGNNYSTLEQDTCKAVGANLTLIAKAATTQSMSFEHPHRLLRHVSAPCIKAFAIEAGIRVTGNMSVACDVCTLAKPIAKPFTGKLAGNARQLLAVIHTDVRVMPLTSKS
ncbi:hypothetical protein GGH96_001187 [Coemansia sp. RSA 1972]|nr:hypothetical protein GGH96_001187 [Coemansia sp. RSA 1972]